MTDLDRAHHADDSAAWLERRRVEDGAAVALAGWEPEHLEFLEAQFPAWRIPQMRAAIANAPDQFVSLVADDPRIETDPDTLLAEVAPLLPADATVYGPVGIGGHPDHRDLARATRGHAGSQELRDSRPRPVKWCTRLRASSSPDAHAAVAIAITSSGSSTRSASALAIESALM